MRLILALTTIVLVSLPSFAAYRCPPIKQSTLLLPSEQLFARKYFIDRARRLNDSGRCIVEGGFDKQMDLFFYRVNDTDDARETTVLRYTFKELSNRNISM
ncbi:MAG: hypothetical protein HXX11_23270 [Desulfuromonadales bacterium]|nr:hypothetical protein [Desulfuromonadales bacterium]